MKQQRSGKIIAVSSVCGNCTIRRWMIIAMQRRGTSAPAVTIGGRPLTRAREVSSGRVDERKGTNWFMRDGSRQAAKDNRPRPMHNTGDTHHGL
jgi:hypothetical protein